MALWGRSSARNYGDKNIRECLENRLAELRENFPEYIEKQMNVMNSVDDLIDGQLQSRLKEESKLYKGERISIIPYNLNSSHWAGLLIEFDGNGRLQRAEYIDVINHSNIIPKRLKNQFVQIYDDSFLQVRHIQWQDSTKPDHEQQLIEHFLAAIINSPNRRGTGSLSRLSELRNIRNNKLRILKISELTMLAEEIHRTEQKMKEYEKNGSVEKMNRKSSKLTELKELLDISREISILESSLDADELQLDGMGKRLQNGLEKFKISDMRKVPEKIDETKQRIEEFQKKKKIEKMEDAKAELNELIALAQLHERIIVETSLIRSREKTMRQEFEILCEDKLVMPDCAEKSIVELVQYFQQRLLKISNGSIVKCSIEDSLQKLHYQLQRQKILSKDIHGNLRDLDIYIRKKDHVPILRTLKKILKTIRPLNVRELQRLLLKSEKAAEVIRDKDVIITVGTSGSGKSTVVQCIMTNETKELETSECSHTNLAPTRYIEPVFVPLRNKFHILSEEDIILCDLPALDSSVDVEVEITTSVGIMRALAGCSSVKILALSKLESSYDKSSGIQKLINILMSIVDGIEDHVNCLFYAFTNFSSIQDVNSLLVNMQASKVTSNFTKSDIAAVKLLDDMIEKIRNGPVLVDSIRHDTNYLMEKLKALQGIRDPGKHFRFSLSEGTRATIVNQVGIYKAGIVSAIDCKDIDLIVYYLNDLSTLKSLFNQNFIREAYESSVLVVKESIVQDYSQVLTDLKKYLMSENTFNDQDLQNCVTFIDYIKSTERLSKHLENHSLSPMVMLKNIECGPLKRSHELLIGDFSTANVRVFLDNLDRLKNLSNLFEPNYNLICQNLNEHFDKLVKSVEDSIRCDEFETVGEMLLMILETSTTLKHHLGEQLEAKYQQAIRFLIEHLSSFVDKSGMILMKFRPSSNDVKKLNEYIDILRSTKENSTLRDCIDRYFEMLKNKSDVREKSVKQSLNEIYNRLIEQLVGYFDNISKKIQKILLDSNDQSSEATEQMIVTMEMIRKIPEIEPNTDASYYRIVETIRECADQLDKESKKLIDTIDTQSADTHRVILEKLLTGIEKIKWIDHLSPGLSEHLMLPIREHIIQYAHQLEQSLKRLDISLKYPENVKLAHQLLENIEYLCILKDSVPKLEECRKRILKMFHSSIMNTFDLIQNTFNLQDSTLYQLKNELRELDETKREYDILHLPSANTKLTNDNFEVSKIRPIRTSYSLDHIETMKKMDYLQKKGLNNYSALLEKILELEKNQKPFDFTRKFEVSIAQMALIYLKNCEKLNYIRVRDMAFEMNTILKQYIIEYGRFLDDEINRSFRKILNVDLQEDDTEDCDNLEKRLREFLSLNKYSDVFECIEGDEKQENLYRMFRDYHRKLSDQIEDCKINERNKRLQDHLNIAQRLSCVDTFCNSLFGDNGFRALYKHYQVEMIRQSKLTYTNLLDQISKTDYESVSMSLSRINDRLPNEKDLYQIGFELNNSLSRLMATLRSHFDTIYENIAQEENNLVQIGTIKERLDKIQFVLNTINLHELLDRKTKHKLETFLDDTHTILAEIMLKILNTVEEFIDTDNFFEAEQTMKGLNVIPRELAMYCTSTDVSKKIHRMKEKLDSIVYELMQRDFEDITKYSMNSPKDLVEKLKLAIMCGYTRFNQVLSRILEKIRHHFSEAINQAHASSVNDRLNRLRSLKHALNYLPDEVQTEFRSHLDEISKSIIEDEKIEKRELDDALFDVNSDDEHAVRKLGILAERYNKENRSERLEMLRSAVLQKLSIHRETLVTALDGKSMRSGIIIVESVTLYRRYLGSHFPEIERIDKNIHDLLLKHFLHCCGTLSDITTIEQMQSVQQAFDNIIIYIEFTMNIRESSEEFLSDRMLVNTETAFKRLHDYFNENLLHYQASIKVFNIPELYRSLMVAKRCDGLLNRIKKCRLNHKLVQVLLKNMESISSYVDMIDELKKNINFLKDQLDVELVNDETTRFENRREEFFRNLMKYMDILVDIDSKLKDVLPFDVNAIVLKNQLKQKVQKLADRLIFISSKVDLSTQDADHFRVLYNHLMTLAKYESRIGLDIRQVLDDSEEKIFDQVDVLKKSIRSSNLDVSNVAQIVTKMKFFSENLPMFDNKIDKEIDEVLTFFKQKAGPSMLMQLTMILEKTDIGGRIISEHSSLRGEDWRKRREKMQNQDNLEYVLNELVGDDVAIDVLSTSYQTFRESYENIISQSLAAFDQKNEQEPNLEALILRAKALVREVSPQQSRRIVWSRSFRKAIPELLACIFAVWTLKNTQHYNAMRGIDYARAYLLMPHVAQVLAVFRILGIGYKNMKKNSDELINNLVEIGTGEGKSVVLAVTACAFALTGVDVNCSCYSDILSTRDKNDFASVFRAFDIEDRIEYGTFNKLCENLLNEQCNVRERVREMIMSNCDTISIVEKVTNRRPKVLLIDEVDVFLSDKFYGGTYSPSVFIRDSSIKALLDTIWQNRIFRTLNDVRSTLEYRNCSRKFSNWTALLDEAIKDMIIALESFSSSTYIIQNDKIVYVEGESIVENVVRGYHTVWTYYHENENGHISQSSLEANVGIIINCGTFSYAEMPHEFSYITGVTGTLKTLDKTEIDILEVVYDVRKSTFMPSVFGKCNRIYNPNNDVLVVDESEYFMRIRGEIDNVCKADRAILIFFESEKKLMKFYNAQELISRKNDIQIITEKVSVKDRELLIKRAAMIGRITLLTRTFGRGIDFICRNQQLLLNGGMHVLQTFFSEELSEEYQIMGRGARQGDYGSYRMILLDKDLEFILGATWKQVLPKLAGTNLYSSLKQNRDKMYQSKCAAKQLNIDRCQREHQASKTFMLALLDGDMRHVKKFLLQQNRGVNLSTKASRTVLLIDATSSMSNLLSAAKETICTMFERASEILKENLLDNDVIQMQIAIYRNYNSDRSKILQVSSWETKANSLRLFLNTISCEGGWGHEAIEIGLWHAVRESNARNSISQVILIGDAPANSMTDVQKKRDNLGEAYWTKTEMDKPTYYEYELEELKRKNIPVHAFYLTSFAEDDFRKIANETGGRCEYLDIHSTDGATFLTDFVTEEILRNAAGEQGNDIVESYRMKYTTYTF